MNFEFSLSGKWLELLKQIAPDVTRVAVLRDAAISAGIGLFSAIQSAAPSLRMHVSPVNVRDPDEIERAVAAFARAPNGGLIVTGSGLANLHRDLIITLAALYKLPAVYPFRVWLPPAAWSPLGLMKLISTVAPPDTSIASSRAKSQRPTGAGSDKYELVINLKTAKALGLEVFGDPFSPAPMR